MVVGATCLIKPIRLSSCTNPFIPKTYDRRRTPDRAGRGGL